MAAKQENMTKKKICIVTALTGIGAGVIIFSLHNIGFGISMAAILVSLMGLDAKVDYNRDVWAAQGYLGAWGFDEYKNLRSPNNPLYQRGCFRKRRNFLHIWKREIIPDIMFRRLMFGQRGYKVTL